MTSQVINPSSSNLTESSTVQVIMRNPSTSSLANLIVSEIRLTSTIAGSLGLTAPEIVIAIPGVVEPIPSAARNCPKPRLGVLCGADAVGAIIGIILGGLILIGLAIMAVLYSRRGRVGCTLHVWALI